MDGVKTHKLIMYNDDINSFEFIMGCLIRFCGHDPIQAEQCALIAHHKGECQIKSGSQEEMLDRRHILGSRGIKTEVHEYESYLS